MSRAKRAEQTERENEGMKKTGRSSASTRLAVPPTGIEPISAEPESAILSIELRRQMELVDAKLLQKSEMRKDIVIELSYKGFG